MRSSNTAVKLYDTFGFLIFFCCLRDSNNLPYTYHPIVPLDYMLMFIERSQIIAFPIKTKKCRRWHRVYVRPEDFSEILISHVLLTI
jgi:hypothetical protein